MQADLENAISVNEALQKVQAAAHRDLLFVRDRIAKYQASCERFQAQNQYLQQHILTLVAVGTMPYTTPNPSIRFGTFGTLCNLIFVLYMLHVPCDVLLC